MPERVSDALLLGLGVIVFAGVLPMVWPLSI